MGLPAPPAALVGGLTGHDNQNGVSDLRFANQMDAFAYGPTLWATHDGSAHWNQVSIDGQVNDLAVADGYAFAVVAPSCSPGSKCSNALYRSAVGSDNWVRLDVMNVDRSVAVHGPDVVAQTKTTEAPGPSLLLVSHDHGEHFATYPSPDVGLPCSFDEPAAAVVWALCVTGMQAAITRSDDGGITFPPRRQQQNQPFANSATLGAASSTTAAVASGHELYLTTDGGQTFEPTTTGSLTDGGSWFYVGFTDVSHGAAIAGRTDPGTTTLYRSTDGGTSWAAVTIGS